jgi:ketosteroid isomerase-like protein
MSSVLSSLERLEIESACQRLVYEYLRALDGSDWDRLANCFVDDGTLTRPMQPEQVLQGREAIRDSMKGRPKGLITRHLATNVLIDVASRDVATGVTTLVMIGCTPADTARPPFESGGPLYFGEFRDRFARDGGQWRFLERRGSIAIKY